MLVTIEWHLIELHVPTYFHYISININMYLLPPKLSTLQIKMVHHVLVMEKIALFSLHVVHVPNKEVGVLPSVRKDF